MKEAEKQNQEVRMENPYGGGSWGMIPNVQTHSNTSTPSNQDHMYLLPQQQFQSPPLYQPPPPPQRLQQPPPPQQHHQSLASHFHLFHLVEKLAEAIDNGNRDQQTDALITDLNNHFEKCQQLLNSISGSISSKSVTVEGQKRKLEETEQMLNQRRDLINKYRNSINEIVKSEP